MDLSLRSKVSPVADGVDLPVDGPVAGPVAGPLVYGFAVSVEL